MRRCSGVVLSLYQAGDQLAGWLSASSPNVFVLLILLNIVFLVMGVFVDAAASIIILVPLMVNTLDAFGIDRVHFGVMMILNLGIGLMLPPHGLAMLIVLRFAGIRMGPYMREALAGGADAGAGADRRHLCSGGHTRWLPDLLNVQVVP